MAAVVDRPVIRPQEGPQETFLSSAADIAIYGGSAFGGKTFALLLECGRNVAVSDFSFTCFRRTTPQITNQGALWDESHNVFRAFGGEPRVGDHSWQFPSGAKGRFAHLEEEKTIYDYDGAQIPLICFDQLEQFTEKQFFYLLSRNRSACKVRPYMRATANPPGDKEHWLRKLLDWWIGPDGYPIPSRSGVVRHFTRLDGKVQWVDADFRDAEGQPPKSLTFIPAKYSDNKIGLKANPDYVANLNAQSKVDRMRLKEGNWDAVEDLEGRAYHGWSGANRLAAYEPDKRRPIFIGMDFNFDPMSSVLLQQTRIDGKDAIVAFKANAFRNCSTEAACERILEEWGTEFRYIIYPDPACNMRTGHGVGLSDKKIIEDTFQRSGAKFSIRVRPAHPKRKDRLNAVNKVLEDKILYVVAESCAPLVRDLDKCKMEEFLNGNFKDASLGHASDGLGYFIEYEYKVRSIHRQDEGSEFPVF
jgi:hypothetical protein